MLIEMTSKKEPLSSFFFIYTSRLTQRAKIFNRWRQFVVGKVSSCFLSFCTDDVDTRFIHWFENHGSSPFPFCLRSSGEIWQLVRMAHERYRVPAPFQKVPATLRSGSGDDVACPWRFFHRPVVIPNNHSSSPLALANCNPLSHGGKLMGFFDCQ